MKIRKGLLLVAILHRMDAHVRLECPPPRSGETGKKVGPCDAPDNPLLPAFPLIPGALNTITWLESIPHPGAPSRLALSRDGDDSVDSFESCILLDHIPHDEYSQPKNFTEPLTYHRSSITVWIPDIKCERCHLQLISTMSDELHGLAKNTSCIYLGARSPGDPILACLVVYHSCAPVSINGTVPRNEIDKCNTTEFEEILEWPRKPSDSVDNYYDYSKYYYQGDPGIYNNSRLLVAGDPLVNCDDFMFCDPEEFMDVTTVVPDDAKYTAMEGTCAAIVDADVEDFILGKLPDTSNGLSEDSEDDMPTSGISRRVLSETIAIGVGAVSWWSGML